MDVGVVGGGRFGLSLVGCLADLGHEVTAVVPDTEMAQRVNDGETPVDEPGLGPLITAYAGRTLEATTDVETLADTSVVLLAVTPWDARNQETYLDDLESAARDVGTAVKSEYPVVAIASPVPPGTTETRLVPALEDAIDGRVGEAFGLAVTPSFQRPGQAVDGFLSAHRLLIGTNDDIQALDRLAELYEPLVVEWDVPVVETGRTEAETIRYAHSAVTTALGRLEGALRNVCAAVDADPDEVTDALDIDIAVGEFAPGRANPDHLADEVDALVATAEKEGLNAEAFDELFD